MATTKTYTLNVNGNAQPSMAALRKEVRDLDKQLGTLPAGSASALAALQRIADAKDQIGDLRAEIAALAPDAKLKGFLTLGEAATSAFSVATVAAKEFGLSGGSIEQYQAKLIGLISVIQSIETFRSALEPEKFAGIKAVWSSITGGLASVRAGFSLTAIQARVASITIRQAMIGTGIGALVVLIGVLIANFDKVKEAGAQIYQRFKPAFDGVKSLIDGVVDGTRNLLNTLTFGMVNDAATAAQNARLAVEQEAAKTAEAQQKAAAERLANRRSAVDKELDLDRRQAVATAKARGDSEIEITRVQLQEARKREEIYKAELNGTRENRIRYQEAAAERVTLEKDLTEKIRKEAEDRRKKLDDEQKKEFDAFLKRTEGINSVANPIELITTLKVPPLPEELKEIEVPVKLEFEDPRFEIITDSLARATQAAGSIVQNLTSDAASQLDARVAALQDRLQQVDAQLSEVTGRVARDEQALASSSGQRRASLIAKIEAEKRAETSLRAERKKAADEQMQVEKERQKLQSRANQANQIAVAIETILATVEMIRTAAKSGQFAGPAAPFVIAATAAAGVAAAVSLKNALRFAEGGYVTGPGGPREDRIPALLSNGEFVMNAEATARFRAQLETMNQVGRTRYVPARTSFADGGLVTGAQPGGSWPTNEQVLAQLATISAQMESLRAAVLIAPTLLPKPTLRIGTLEAEAITEQQNEAAQQKALATF